MYIYSYIYIYSYLLAWPKARYVLVCAAILPDMRKTLPTGGARSAPPFGRAFPAAGAAQTPKIDDSRSAQKPWIENPSVAVRWALDSRCCPPLGLAPLKSGPDWPESGPPGSEKLWICAGHVDQTVPGPGGRGGGPLGHLQGVQVKAPNLRF